MVTRNPMRVSWPVTMAATGLFVWGLWSAYRVWESMGPLFEQGDAVTGQFVGQTPVVGLIGLGVLTVFVAALLALVGELGSDEPTVSTGGE